MTKKMQAFSVLECKEFNDEQRVIRGLATSPVPDRADDVVEPMGAKFATTIPLFLYHDSRLTVGTVKLGKPTKKGIPFEATIPKILEEGKLKDRVDEAWQLVKYKLIAAVSIGFRSIEGKVERLQSGGLRFLESEILELSLVPVPMQSLATIDEIKSFDSSTKESLGIKSLDGEMVTASGLSHELNNDYKKSLGVTGKSNKTSVTNYLKSNKGIKMKKSYVEMIADLKAKKAELALQVGNLMEKSVEEGRTFDEHESELHDNAMSEIKSIDEHIVRLENMKSINVANAVDVTDANANANTNNVENNASNVRRALPGAGVIQVVSNLPKGTAFTRYVMALTRSKGNAFEATEYAKRWTDTPEVSQVLKAASSAGSTTDADWASKLVSYQDMASEFIDLLRPMTILGKFGQAGIPSLRRVPFNIRMATQTTGGTYGWVGQGAPKPVGELTIGEVTLKWAKAAGIIVVTDELMRMSNPSVEAVVRNDMLRGMAQFSDSQFIDPSIAAVADVSPASVLNGVAPVPSTGTDADALRLDIGTLWNGFFSANLAPTTGVWIMSNRQAMRISLMRNALGQKEFPDMTPLGGILEGFPVITSEAVPDGSDGGIIAFVNADDIFFSDDGPVTIDASREASLQMNTTPDNPATASTVMVSLWQNNMIALRAERYMNWKKRRSVAAGFIESANYGTT